MLPYQSCTEWGLQRASVAGARVSSYLAFPSLPAKRAVSFCCTFPGVASAGCYPALCPVVLGLSSPALAGAVAFLTQIMIHLSKRVALIALRLRFALAQSLV